uniref:Uncharacterized protein n=1 Tax=Amphimedon queenslandica TaxID=400682 RepID=A0A1X7THJ2_AMPQE
MEGLTFLLQTFVSTLASMMVGFLWHSELLFGRSWWRNTFPGIRFGDTKLFKEAGNFPLYMTMIVTIIQNIVLTYVINTLYPLLVQTTGDGVFFPAACSVVISIILSCVIFPHFVYSRKPFVLYLIAAGHNVFQTTAAIFVIYYLIATGKD